jgi:hypothetical protein
MEVTLLAGTAAGLPLQAAITPRRRRTLIFRRSLLLAIRHINGFYGSGFTAAVIYRLV